MVAPVIGGGALGLWAVRLALVGVGLAGWFWTQRLIAVRACPSGRIGDAVHALPFQ